MNNQHTPIYTTSQIREGEKLAAKKLGIPMYELMERAGKAIFHLMTHEYATAKKILVLCGTGNNGGDGYVVAKLAKLSGLDVTLWHVGDSDRLTGDALTAQQGWLGIGGEILSPSSSFPKHLELIIDGMLGTGLSGNVRRQYAEVIERVNLHPAPVVAVDVPSGLCADSGFPLGTAIEAEFTVTFIGMKKGLVTGRAKNFTGTLSCDSLGTSEYFKQNVSTPYQMIGSRILDDALPKRKPNSHKGNFGKVLLVGGAHGMGGAITLAASACARTGAGLTKVITYKDNAPSLLATHPEIMIDPNMGNKHLVNDSLQWADTLVLGPGLGQLVWGSELYHLFCHLDLPKVLDADALNFLATQPDKDDNRIITPHPGEASRLLECTVAEVEDNRYQAAANLHEKFGGVVVLKGAGTIVYDGGTFWVCGQGNPGMSTGGMGDVLSGVIGSLLGQKLNLLDAAKLGVWLHSNAADWCAREEGTIGLLASDLLPYLRKLINKMEE
ncbi:bifunctional ADP-dependent NAD(P)H-hydrate dehydratase/NAD(P)H-hydrate epimerase [Vibrio nigripulchritudo]|uniref:bifunctional ADP-dependent NAD(P)H-hydrate dehydratase/NAD(P)H-hydrate epimerase n=1 Tax=Vibrio nigripulchritudo TaxID=28173 RepID=UPI0005FA5D31|nr:bifunctional ADP-dependent NAD(P)H-hydrate dehydratase/NAD(P)H-hydrate epimerase [Vibrio nigripulchritudo]KJY72120.1 NAD(P)H-hydrate epimerase [Vibrio nigripulchritudo]